MRPEVVATIAALRARTRAAGSVAFVPTMGALHEGHLTLAREAARRGELAVMSIFVNPLQFGPNEDFSRYPRPLEADLDKAGEAGTHLVFAPTPDEMYPPGDQTRVAVPALARGLCGPHRPGHFDGVATVVCKLLNAVGPCVAIFGRKDYQQLKVIERMVRDLAIPAEIVGMPIVREPDGLAMSSRNAYLSPPERERALSLSRGLASARAIFAAGERDAAALRAAAHSPVAAAADSIDYVTVADPESLEELASAVGDRALVAIAARIGRTRLIDNVVLPGLGAAT
ncbi:MAG: pantoate--beta-alanine ligase [Deltaproteobacteria bacterium]|nr:pantoate--beta-alanine ligase [Deltaproteobacteria bacterium]